MNARLHFLLLLLALPAAASAAPVSGALRFHEAPRVDGDVTLVASPALVDVDTAPGAALSWQSAEGRHEGRSGVATAAGTAAGTARWSTPISVGAGHLRVVGCLPGCRLALVLEAGKGEAGATGPYAGTIRQLVVPAARDATLDATPVAAHVRWAGRTAALAIADHEGLATFAYGRGRLVLWNVTVDLVTPEGVTRLATGARHSPLADPRVPMWSTNVSHAILEIEGVSLLSPASRILAPALDARLDGLLESASASGWVDVGGERMRLDESPFQVLGSLRVESTALAPVPLGDDGARSAIAGEAQSVRIGAYAAAFDPPAARIPETGLALALGTLLLLLAVKLALAPFYSPFYSRLSPRTLLSNGNRERLYALVCERPGESAAPLAAAAGLGRMVAQYHLRVLERHRLVVGQGEGRLRLYFPTSARRPDEEALSTLLVLKSPTRRVLAAHLRDAPEGRTQVELAELCRLSQRLVSYHLAALEKSGLVEGSGGRPRRFTATPALDEALP